MKFRMNVLKKFGVTCLLLTVLLYTATPVFGQLSDKSEVSLLTIGKGKDLYAAFGHSAIYISDPDFNRNDVYNYGTFSFGPDFYLKFTKGEMDYMLTVSRYRDEIYAWKSENRRVVKQVLNLSLDQKNRLLKFLMKNSLPENRVYRYDYFYDNCSNRIDSALKMVLGKELMFSAEKVVEEHKMQGATVRDLTHACLLNNPWGELGIETCLGIAMDKELTPEQFKFIPDYLMWNVDAAKIKMNGAVVPLLKEQTVLYEPTNITVKKTLEEYVTPLITFALLAILAIVVSVPLFRNSIVTRVVDFVIFFSCGLVGLLLVYLWFFTTHRSQINFNLIWANPFSIVVAFLILSKKRRAILENYFLIYGVILLLTLVFWVILPQHLNNAYIFLCFAVSLRSLVSFWVLKKTKH